MVTEYEEKIAQWLTSDPALVKEAVIHTRRATGLEDIHPLDTWATNLLFDPTYGGLNEDLRWISNRGGDMAKADKIRKEMTVSAFDLYDWNRIGQLILAYTKENNDG